MDNAASHGAVRRVCSVGGDRAAAVGRAFPFPQTSFQFIILSNKVEELETTQNSTSMAKFLPVSYDGRQSCLTLNRTPDLADDADYHNQEDSKTTLHLGEGQAYIVNGAKLVFLNQRPQIRPFSGTSKTCSTCERGLQEPHLFCSLGVKFSMFIALSFIIGWEDRSSTTVVTRRMKLIF